MKLDKKYYGIIINIYFYIDRINYKAFTLLKYI